MMADHGDLCNGQDATYCINGGTCYKIAAMNTLTCVCDESYKGSRCEQFQLFSSADIAGQTGLVAALTIVALLLLAILALIVYFIHKKLKAKQQNQQNIQQPYWKVQSRA